MRPFTLLSILLLVFTILLFWQKPMPQTLEYHAFADSRVLLNIPNFWNVMSNLPFFFIGIYGIQKALKNWSLRSSTTMRCLTLVLSIGIFATSFGSAYYHWLPNNDTLVWDRLPMTLMFMALFSLVVYDFCGKKVGERTFWISILVGIGSVAYWHWTESTGAGDLRPYALVQFFPLLALPFLFGFFPKKVNYGKYILGTAVFYILAKICEYADVAIFEFTKHLWSGHTIKHLLASVALYYMVKLLDEWRIEQL
jgi:hypothetical protein